MEEVKTTWGEPTKEEPQRNDYINYYYFNGSNTIDIYFDPDGKIFEIRLEKGMYLGG